MASTRSRRVESSASIASASSAAWSTMRGRRTRRCSLSSTRSPTAGGSEMSSRKAPCGRATCSTARRRTSRSSSAGWTFRQTVRGREATEDDMRRIGRGISDLERYLDIERGHTKAKDTLPKRLLEGEVDVNGKRVKLGEATWERLRDEYYRYRGWSSDGVPKRGIAE